MTDDLKPCPFCGGEAEIWRAQPDKFTAWITCMGRCSVLVSKEYKTNEEAIAAWNTRTPSPASGNNAMFADLAARQQPLGAEFEAAIFDNLDDLYEVDKAPASGEPVAARWKPKDGQQDEWEYGVPHEGHAGDGWIHQLLYSEAYVQSLMVERDAAFATVDALSEKFTRHMKSFHMAYESDIRAIKRWQQAHPDNDLVWPDRTDLSVWLMAEVSRLEAALTTARNDAIEKFDSFLRTNGQKALADQWLAENLILSEEA